jgi:hypothetical protein
MGYIQPRGEGEIVPMGTSATWLGGQVWLRERYHDEDDDVIWTTRLALDENSGGVEIIYQRSERVHG